MKVVKFGGTSLATAEAVRQVCAIVAADAERRIVVVSAPGRRDPRDTKVTDLLIAAAEARLAGQPVDGPLQAVVERYRAIQEGLGLPGALLARIEQDLRRRVGGDPAHRARFLDAVKAGGEDNGAKLLAAALEQRGVRAAYVGPAEAGLLLSDEYGNARLLSESYANLSRLREAEEVVVFPGFFGVTPDGDIVTFPRGGSDITGAILAAAVRANVYENFTDVDSVLAVDPELVPDAKPIAELTYREMRELAYAGFHVIHDEAIVPAVHAGIPISVRNTRHPEREGTWILPERRHVSGEVVGIASDAGFCTIFISKYLMNRELGFGRRLLQIIEEEGLSYEHAPSGIDNISVILREEAFDAGTEAHVLARIRRELAVDDVYTERGLALVMLVGEGMRYSVGLAARATRSLADAGINIEMMNQGASEISMLFGVKAADRTRAVQALYRAFFRAPG